MSKIKNYMMDIEDFCNGYSMGDFTIDEVVEDVGMYFKSNEASEYAKRYLTEQMGEE
jgi:hypothetical protein